MSNGFNETDKIVFPNIPWIAVTDKVIGNLFGLGFIFFQPSLFLNKEVKDFLWGYKDMLVSTAAFTTGYSSFGVLMKVRVTWICI
jgi:CD36 family